MPRPKPLALGRRHLAHEWVSFEDPDEARTWVFDLTFLLSRWTCIFGRGCQGVLTGPAEDLVQGCCSYGAHFVDDEDEAAVAAAAARLTADQWQHRARGRRGGTVVTDEAGARVTRLIDGACIFLNRPGFSRGPGCALHVGALDAGERPLDWKPDVCWQLPLRREDVVEGERVTSTVRQWERSDWGEGGAEFHWWCTDGPDAFVGHRPVYQELRDEIVEMVGEGPYLSIVSQLRERIGDAPTNPQSTTEVFLPHPALRSGQT